MTPDAAALVAAREALRTRIPVVLIHLVSSRGVGGDEPGLRAWYTDAEGLTGSVHNSEVEAVVAREAASVLVSGHPRMITLGTNGTDATRRDSEYVRVFLDVVVATPRLLIVGAGHIAQPLANISSVLGFETVVLDERADFANRDRFPSADEVFARPIEAFLEDFVIDDRTFVVLVPRAHRFDEAALRLLLGSPAPYIGMIGSRRRVHVVYKTLLDEGFRSEQFERVFAPIGLDIGAKTPAEIALAISAELINVRRHGRGSHLSIGDFRLGQAGRS